MKINNKRNLTIPIFVIDNRENFNLIKESLNQSSNLNSLYNNEYLIGFTNAIKIVEESCKENYKEGNYK